MTEADLTRRIIKALNSVPNTYAFKVHGGPNQAGVSDVICCHKGQFYALEVKLPGKERKISLLQAKFLQHVNEADGVGILVTSVKQALEEVMNGYNESQT